MPDENNRPPDIPPPDAPEIAPSTIFVELMRQAAARRQRESEPAAPTPPPDLPSPPEKLDPLPPIPTPEPPHVRQRLRLTPEALPPHAPEPTLEPPAAPPKPTPPPPTEDMVAAARLEAQRIQRIQRRRERVTRHRVGVLGGFLRTALIILVAAGVASTIFTWFTSPEFLDQRVVNRLVVADSTNVPVVQPTALPTPNYLQRIGIVSGHRGPQNDPGAVCPDGLTEASINFEVATRVVRSLRSLGYSVDLLDEFDARLDNYRAAALVSIHANTCRDFGERVSGFLVAKAAVRPSGGVDDLLAECIALHYGRIIGIERRFNLTRDMTDYHTFREIHPLTPAAIIELGFMKDDREILTTRQDDMAQALVEGVLCFLSPGTNELLATPDFFIRTPTPTPR
ncbi:MAG: N-acetylmuramoyl-L-alanine amidase [Anaerolineae bacterium]